MSNRRVMILALLLSMGAIGQAGEPPEQGLRLADPEVLEALRASDTPGLPRHLTPEERPHLRLPDFSRVPRTPPVAEDLMTASEFERNEAIIMRWGDQNSVLTEMIVPITTGDGLADVLLVVANASQQASAASTLDSAGADLDRVEFLIAPSDSVWIRDYGPRFTSADNERVIVDHEYNRPRPLDNQVPGEIANHLGEDLYDMPINHGGGNFHLFSNGEAYMTDLIVDENPGYSDQDVIDLYADYQGVDLTLLPALPASFDSTQHLDMWFLPVDDQTVIIGEYDENEAGGVPHQVTEFTASLMESRGYTVLRTPGWRTAHHHTYTNAVIVNDLVLMCHFNGYADENAQAQAVFEQAFPDLDIVPVDCSGIIQWSGALHCIVKHQPAPTFRVQVEAESASVCASESGAETLELEVSLRGLNDFDEPVTLQTTGEPAGVSSQFSPATVSPPDEATWTLSVEAGAEAGTSDISLFGDDGIGPGLPVGFSLTVETPLPGPDLEYPADQAEDIPLQPVLDWAELEGAVEYRVQLASDPDFEQIIVDEWVSEPMLAIDQVLDSGELHYWRSLATGNACGDGSWSETRQFRTRFDPIAEVSPEDFTFEVHPNGADTDTLTITNVGDGELEWTIATESCSDPEPAAWLQVDTSSGSTGVDQPSEIQVSVDADGLESGLHVGGLCVTSNEFDGQPLSVPVWLDVADLPPGQLQIEPGSLAFGQVAIGSSDGLDLTVGNVAEAGSADLVIDQIQIVTGESVFSLDEANSDCGSTVPAQSECTVAVRFAPDSLGARSGVLRVTIDGKSHNISLGGHGVEPEPEIFRDRFEAAPQ